MDLDGRFDAVELNVNNLVSCGGNLQDVWDVLILGAKLVRFQHWLRERDRLRRLSMSTRRRSTFFME